VTSGMTTGQKADVQTAWHAMRTVQQLAAQERTTEELKQSETLAADQEPGVLSDITTGPGTLWAR
jgi:hypothetical protein